MQARHPRDDGAVPRDRPRTCRALLDSRATGGRCHSSGISAAIHGGEPAMWAALRLSLHWLSLCSLPISKIARQANI